MLIAIYTVMMRARNSLIVPIVSILSGVLLELKSLGLFGDFLSDDIFMKLWPLLAVAAGLDLLFNQRRIIGAAIVLFFAAALASTQFMSGGWNNPVWQLFLKIWPILLILFGVDSIFAGKSLINAAVIIMAVVLAVYVVLVILDVPVLQKLPINIDLRSIIPSETFSWERPTQNQQTGQTGQAGQTQPDTQQDLTQIVSAQGGPVAAAILPQQTAQLNLSAVSGRVSLKAGAPRSQFLSGTIALSGGEKLSPDVKQTGQAAIYTIQSSGNASSSTESNWDLTLSALRPTTVNAVLNNGYIKADLRGLNLTDVSIQNKFGPIDVMVPESTGASIRITAESGDIRVYIPKGCRISAEISGAASIEYPQRNYILSGTSLTPRSMTQQPVAVEVSSNSGTVRIIEIE